MSCHGAGGMASKQPMQEAIDGIPGFDGGHGLHLGNENGAGAGQASGLKVAGAGLRSGRCQGAATAQAHGPAGLVPWLDDGELRIHDSLAIAEYLHECCPERHLYPVDKAERALARSLCAELHAGFRQIRTLLPFFLGRPPRVNRRWRSLTSWPGCRPSGPRRGALLFRRGEHSGCLLCGDGLSTGKLWHFAARSGWRLSAGLAGLAPVAGNPAQGEVAVAKGGPPV